MGDFTYEHLFDVLRRERSREEIQELDEGFYSQAHAFINQQQQALDEAKESANNPDLIRTQLSNSKKLLKELYERREKKIIQLAVNKVRTQSSLIDTSNVLDSEQGLYDRLTQALVDVRKEILLDLVSAVKPITRTKKPPSQAPKKTPPPAQSSNKSPSNTPADGVTIKVTASVPKFLGTNSKTYGPYDPGKEVRLPERIAQILIKKGRAEQV